MSDLGPPPLPPPPGPYEPQPYGQQPYGQQSYGQQPIPPSLRSRVTAELGERLARRPEPRFTVALAGAGAGLALLGVFIWGVNYVATGLGQSGFAGSTNRNLLGAALAAVLAVLGYLVVISARRGPLATAGVVAAGIGFPMLIGFLTFDVTSRPLPINFDAIFWVSVIVWIASYLFVPGGAATRSSCS